ncbi:succinyl-diaminopimelate desuccinylase [Friedmanniella endophytica]|uniref:Succinyl-diaminopimelate desuccinylase n=1 Tax=Microlunatus kandeliicorticis TaxID=1759536 RepID=A0A7W3ISN0_9ACTN|nr:succinyl-diaminopimelate desuccinylase [Microlunatus kandeliicorticis]MBA8794495.1 succinyl-diaminopimelate desuccinylase [Microlunatus kandeliicorticis]
MPNDASPTVPTALDLTGDVVALTRALVDVESVSGNEQPLADLVEQALRRHDHLTVLRDGNVVLARTETGAPERVVIAGHIDTVPLAGNLPSWIEGEGEDQLVYGRGSCDMKSGVAVQLSVAAACERPVRDVTWVFYDNEEVEAERNGLNRIARTRPELLAGDFAVLCEPSGAGIEGGCQGTMRVEVELRGRAAHSARSWMGENAVHAAAGVLGRLVDYAPRQVEVEGLTYREGLNAVDIRGGIAGNVIPDRCVVAVNYRFAPDRDAAAAEAHLRAVFAGYDLTVVDVAEGARPGLDQPAAAAFLAAVGGEPRAKFGWTDVARFSAMGIPAVNYGPGDPSKAHADDEFCPAAEIRSCREALLRWLQG